MKINKIIPLSLLVFLGFIFFVFTCNASSSHKNKIPEPILDTKFNEYWYDGKAEIANYNLKQSRYGEERIGTATLIFVTEPFSKSKQVKLDDYTNETDRQDVLKMNATRKFQTGVYPYSIMTSAFSPLAKKGGVTKITNSVQEWCGHTFLQFNEKGNVFKVSGKSYFETEGDLETTINKVYTEDELFNLIRMSPENLPVGKFKIIPAQLHTRFSHSKIEVFNATAELKQLGERSAYTLSYKNFNRTLRIDFESKFPFTILQWQEDIKKGNSTYTSIATLEKSVRLDYWNKNANAFNGLLEEY